MMRRYKSHKIVEAGRIQRIHTTTASGVGVIDFVEVGGQQIAVPQEWSARGVPEIGDYLVRYGPDGYLSWSPAAVFEAGYRLVEDASGSPVPTQRKASHTSPNIGGDEDDVDKDGSCDENGQQA